MPPFCWNLTQVLPPSLMQLHLSGLAPVHMTKDQACICPAPLALIFSQRSSLGDKLQDLPVDCGNCLLYTFYFEIESLSVTSFGLEFTL